MGLCHLDLVPLNQGTKPAEALEAQILLILYIQCKYFLNDKMVTKDTYHIDK